MYSKNGSAPVGTRSLVIAITGVVALAASSAGAEPVATINGTSIDSAVLEVYAESRTQRPIGDIGEQDRQTLISELVDLYILSTQPDSADLKKDPRIAAQIELQERVIVAQAFAARYIAEKRGNGRRDSGRIRCTSGRGTTIAVQSAAHSRADAK